MKKIVSFIPVITLGLALSSCSGLESFDKSTSLVFNIDSTNQVVSGLKNWSGPNDCSARAYMTKTESGLLVTVEVKDDSVRTGNSKSYMNDGVELYFDLRPPRLRVHNYYERGVFQASVEPEASGEARVPIHWFPTAYNTRVQGAQAFTRLSDSGYVVQVSIPFAGLKRTHYWPRTKFYMDIAVNDADSGKRESQLMWKGKANDWNSPHNFEAVIFREDERKKKKKPNILFVFTDQQTLKALSGNGNPYLQTPAMDGLAGQGVRFTRSYCTSPVCSPSRSSLITSRMPHETGVIYNGTPVDSTLENMGQIFRKAGYNTIWAGKWHLPESYPQSTKKEIPGFKLLDFVKPQNISGRGDFMDEPLADAVVRFLNQNHDDPFLLAVSFHNPHDICAFAANPGAFPPPLNIKATPPLPENFRISPDEPEFIKDCRNRTYYGNELNMARNFSPDMWRQYLYQYYRMTERVDHQVGRVINALESNGLDENTLIIFTSDHGDGGAAHHWAAKLSFYQESVNIPLIVTWFGKTPVDVTDSTHVVNGLDVLPTMLDYAGIDIPPDMEGRSLKTIIDNPGAPWRDYVVCELAPDPKNPDRIGRMITNGRFKYNLYSYGRHNEQLFDLEADPGEENDLVYDPAYSSVRQELRKQLDEWMSRTGDYFNTTN